VNWSRVCVDASHVKAKKGGSGVGPSPVDRGKPGSKHHVVCDGDGLPLRVITTGGNVPDIAMAEALIAGIPPVAGRIGRPRSRPDAVLADKGYDSIAFRAYLKRRGILAVISQRKRRDIIGLGSLRWVVERTIAHLHQFKRLAVRWERRIDLHEALTVLAARTSLSAMDAQPRVPASANTHAGGFAGAQHRRLRARCTGDES
jgi:transposase